MEIYYDKIRDKLDELRELVDENIDVIANYLEYQNSTAAIKDIPEKCFTDEYFDECMFYDDGKLHLKENGLLELVMTSNKYKAFEFQNLIRPVIRKAKENNIEL